ncbi:EamA family transporter RarD [Microbacterium sp. H1-D42]|uniref:EamA family transporter RarD n=1 Tax=Microbacterium sp. H1-D42 TaxID=2925844 RepID=UPI001F5374C7|nr:EamA family transporter RarD [Microbacterium sp. H1-D42]UNK70073.1 EamA family transporter RarD [Microbacterium sp. H1-D42]
MTSDLSASPAAARGAFRSGVAFTVGAYLIWGVLPLYFLALAPTGPWEVVAWRVLLSFVFCLILLTVMRGWSSLWRVVRRPALLGWTALAGVLIYVNWQVFLIGTLSDRVIETSLGYFINPIFTVLLGVIVLRERITRLQAVAIGIAAVAVVVIIVAYGAFPWIAVSLTASFGLYGLVKKRIGAAVDAVSGLTLESFWLIPIAVVTLIVVSQTEGITFGTVSPLHTALVAGAGIATAVPLLLFAAGTRRIDLSLVGMFQFITPVMQFLVGWALLGEPMPLERWAGFILVWIAIIVFVIDLVLQKRRGRHEAPAPVL